MKAMLAAAIALAVPCVLLSAGRADAAAQTRRKPTKIAREPKKSGGPLRPVNITAKLFEVLPTSQQAVWTGDVVVERDDVKVTCDRLTAEMGDGKQIRKVTCEGNAHLIQHAVAPRTIEREAWGDVAVFDNERSTLTVTGSPRAREGQSTMEGTKVVFLVDEDRVLVENAKMVVETANGAGALGAGEGSGKK
jgi:lipopolysaccharide transport protein LptA